MARSRRTSAKLVGRCSSELSSYKLQAKSKKSQALSEAPRRSTAYQRVLWRGVEGPRRCLLADALRSFPATNYREIEKVTDSERSRPVSACRGGICSSPSSSPSLPQQPLSPSSLRTGLYFCLTFNGVEYYILSSGDLLRRDERNHRLAYSRHTYESSGGWNFCSSRGIQFFIKENEKILSDFADLAV